MRPSALIVTAVAALCGLAACSTGGRDAACPGTRPGVAVRVKAPLAQRAESASVTVCWDGRCRTSGALGLMPSSVAVPQNCPGGPPEGVCGASASPTGDADAFVDLKGLPSEPVEVAVVLRDGAGGKLFDREVTVTPKGVGGRCPHPPHAAVVADGARLAPA
ncbi:hypothetical protein Acsp04_16100 [Actinomadura sp. NBRC 104425]|uniref:hypothetical protein n=1 Tax=Actinomadura sp. NBRC 104425 TaxID=3032204 RepID=UPI0024A4C0C4|nr:hypothetical protein [Actinomadura sp. NBRC 104425]GLZ11375.1 hypothetical protein Acsp04_16100 [Actinomadura sp. NBRC 104425]